MSTRQCRWCCHGDPVVLAVAVALEGHQKDLRSRRQESSRHTGSLQRELLKQARRHGPCLAAKWRQEVRNPGPDPWEGEGWTRSLDGTESDQRTLGISKGFNYFLSVTGYFKQANTNLIFLINAPWVQCVKNLACRFLRPVGLLSQNATSWMSGL